jgi:hypothetical protein
MEDNQLLSNIGKKWTITEDEQLLQEVNNNKNYDIIALNHKRTKNAIILRVISHIIYPLYYNDNNNDDINYEIISKEYNIDIELLKKNINKKKEIKKEINEKILEELILLNKKIDKLTNLIMK